VNIYLPSYVLHLGELAFWKGHKLHLDLQRNGLKEEEMNDVMRVPGLDVKSGSLISLTEMSMLTASSI
jgi:hypothetical protein